MASVVEDYDDSWRKARKVEWLQREISPQPPTAILEDETNPISDWLCSGARNKEPQDIIWNDFKSTGLDAVASKYGNTGVDDMAVDFDGDEEGLPLQINAPGVDYGGQNFAPVSPSYSPYLTPDEFDEKPNSGGVANMWAEVVDALQQWDATISPGRQPRGYNAVKNKYREFYNQYYGSPIGMSKESEQVGEDSGSNNIFTGTSGQPQPEDWNVQENGEWQEPNITINLDTPIDPAPTTNAIMRANATNDTAHKYMFSRMRIGIAAQRRQNSTTDPFAAGGSSPAGGLLEHITRRMQNATNFFTTSIECFLIMTGRNRSGIGEITATNLFPGDGPSDLLSITPAGFTTYVVCQGADFQTPIIEDFGVYPLLARELTKSDQGPIQPANINAINVLNPQTNESTGRYIVQLPMSKEGGGGGQNNPALSTRMNLLFFMNPTELKNLMEEGIFHRLEYYSDAFQPTFFQNYETIKEGFANGENASFLQKAQAMMQAVMQSFTGIAAFTGQAQVRLGRPDTMYLFLSWKFYVTKIQELTNELTVINAKLTNGVSHVATTQAAQEHAYNRLKKLIYEMDVWNYIIQTPPDGQMGTDVGYWNFSAFGISRVPGYPQNIATYAESTKPWSCYPRWMYQTFYQMETVEARPPFSQPQQDNAIDRAVLKFNESMPSALEMIKFGNTQSVLKYALLNRAEMAGKSPADKLRMLNQTWANKKQTVGDAMIEQEQSDKKLNQFIAQAGGMDERDFVKITSQPKAASRARKAIAELEAQRDSRIPAFTINQVIQLPDQQQMQAFRQTVKEQTPYGSQINILGNNPRIQITAIDLTGQHIMYSYRRLNQQGGYIDDEAETIQQYYLLAVRENVAKANNNLITRALNLDHEDAQIGLSSQDAARILGTSQFVLTDIEADIDVLCYDARLRELDNRQLVDGNDQPTQAARRADGITLMMATNLREERQRLLQEFRLLQNAAHLRALTQQQGQQYWSDEAGQQEYIYQKYELYKKKWQSLQRAWNTIARIDGISRDINGNRPPLVIWQTQTTAMINGVINQHSILSVPTRVVNTGFCLTAFDAAASKLPAGWIRDGLVAGLRLNVFQKNQTLAQTWNMGHLLPFGEWARIDNELSARTQTNGAQRGQLLTTYNQQWYDNYVTQKEYRKAQARRDAVAEVILAAHPRGQQDQQRQRRRADQLAQDQERELRHAGEKVD